MSPLLFFSILGFLTGPIATVKTGTLLGITCDLDDPQKNAVWKINPDAGDAELIVELPEDIIDPPLAVGADGTVYTIYAATHLATIDIVSGDVTLIGDTGFDDISGLAFATDGVLYGYDPTGFLVAIDQSTGVARTIGDSDSIHGSCLTWGPGDVLYAEGENEECDDKESVCLWAIDPTTGVPSPVGPLGDGGVPFEGPILYALGMETIGDTIYLSAASEYFIGRLFTVSATTGEATVVGEHFEDWKGTAIMNGLAFLPGPGDADRDGDADLDDFARFQSCLTGPINDPDGDKLPVECQFLDADKDRDIDLHDFAVFQNGFTGPNEE